MEKHAVPHNIMDVEFKLFGSLTVRQFTYLAVTFIICLLIYFSGIPGLASYPLIFFIVLIGLGLALLTVNDQPFSVWFSNFVRSMFTAQRRVYHKSNKSPAILMKTTGNAVNRANLADEQLIADAKRRKGLLAERLKKVDLKDIAPVEGENVDTESGTNENLDDLMSERRSSDLDKYFQTKVEENMGKYNLAPATNGDIPDNLTSKVAINEQAGIETKLEQNTTQRPLNAEIMLDSEVQPLAQQRPPGNAQPNVDIELKVLNKLKPNQIAGFICDKEDVPIDQAQVFIKDQKGGLLRSVYSDVHGKFIVPSTLPEGKYYIEISAKGYQFPEYQVELNGEILPMYRYLSK